MAAKSKSGFKAVASKTADRSGFGAMVAAAAPAPKSRNSRSGQQCGYTRHKMPK